MNWNNQIFNGLAVLAISMHPRFSTNRFVAPAIIAGSVIFSGSIFGLVLARERFALPVLFTNLDSVFQNEVPWTCDPAWSTADDFRVGTFSPLIRCLLQLPSDMLPWPCSQNLLSMRTK
jgi:hypothetical protein